MKTNLIEKTEQDKVIELMCQILELKKSSEETVKSVIKEKGIAFIFQNIEELNIEDLEKERLYALKEVIEKKEQELEEMKGED
jgi:hypothetical protein